MVEVAIEEFVLEWRAEGFSTTFRIEDAPLSVFTSTGPYGAATFTLVLEGGPWKIDGVMM